MEARPRHKPGVPIKSIALPVEHGGWGLLLESALAAMILAPSWAGSLLCFAALSVFLINRPFKIFWQGLVPAGQPFGSGIQEPQCRWAAFFVSLYGIVALAAFSAVFFLVRAPFWLPVLLTLPLALIQAVHVTLNESRKLIPELCGGVALGAIAPCVLIAGGWRLEPAFFVWLILAVRTLSTIIYIRNKLRSARGIDFSSEQVIWTHLASLVLLASLAFVSMIPWLAVIGFFLLSLHAFLGISKRGHAAKPRDVGMEEMFWGILNSLLIAAGYLLRRG